MRPPVLAVAELLVFAALMAVLLWVAGRFYQPVRVGGLSMHPTLHVGDIAIIAKRSRPTVGDIVLITSHSHEPVVHRVIGFTPQGAVMTQGDANSTPDQEVASKSEIAGRAVVIVPIGALVERWRANRGYATMSAQSNTARP